MRTPPSVAHPTWLTEEYIDEIAVPVQILAPEVDPMYTADLKKHTLETLPELSLPWDYQYFPGIEHDALSRGNSNKPGEREGMARAKDAVVGWPKVCFYRNHEGVLGVYLTSEIYMLQNTPAEMSYRLESSPISQAVASMRNLNNWVTN